MFSIASNNSNDNGTQNHWWSDVPEASSDGTTSPLSIHHVAGQWRSGCQPKMEANNEDFDEDDGKMTEVFYPMGHWHMTDYFYHDMANGITQQLLDLNGKQMINYNQM